MGRSSCFSHAQLPTPPLPQLQECQPYTPGTPVWVSGKWPGAAWALDLCNRAVVAALVLSRPISKSRLVLVRYYGEHTTAWVPAERCVRGAPGGTSEQRAALQAWCTRTGK